MASDSQSDKELRSLDELLALARGHVMTPEEIFEQKVSWVYGMQDYDKTALTHEEIRRQLRSVEGIALPSLAAQEPVAWRHAAEGGWVVTKNKHMDSEPLYAAPLSPLAEKGSRGTDEAWDAVVECLREIRGDMSWITGPDTGAQAAVRYIKELASRSHTEEISSVPKKVLRDIINQMNQRGWDIHTTAHLVTCLISAGHDLNKDGTEVGAVRSTRATTINAESNLPAGEVVAPTPATSEPGNAGSASGRSAAGSAPSAAVRYIKELASRSHSVTPGWKLVPEEPTLGMIGAAHSSFNAIADPGKFDPARHYRTMLKAAPAAPRSTPAPKEGFYCEGEQVRSSLKCPVQCPECALEEGEQAIALSSIAPSVEEAIKSAAKWVHKGCPVDEAESAIRDVVRFAVSATGERQK